MARAAKTSSNQRQIEKFREAARKHEADESEENFDATLRSIATHKPGDKKTKD